MYLPAAGAPRRRMTGREGASTKERTCPRQEVRRRSRRYDKAALHEPAEAFELVK